jgi:hypothetical protein
MSEKMDQTLAVFLLDSGDAARRLLKTVEKIDKGDKNVKIVDAAIADHRKRGRVKVKQTHDVSGRKGRRPRRIDRSDRRRGDARSAGSRGRWRRRRDPFGPVFAVPRHRDRRQVHAQGRP